MRTTLAHAFVLIVSLLFFVPAASPASAPPNSPATSPSTRPSPVTIETIDRPTLPLRGVVARIDLTDPRVRIVCIPAGTARPGTAPWPTTLETVPAAALRENTILAVNGDFFAAERTVDAEGVAARKQYIRGKKATPTGNAVSAGKLWARASSPVGMVVVAPDQTVSIVRARDVPNGAIQAVSGNRILVENGKPTLTHKDADTRAPRTAAALTPDGKTLLLVVVDGRSLRSRGATLGELATLLAELGAHTAVNLDGGGSSSIVLRDPTGTQKTLNNPSDGEDRPVANLLGVKLDE